MRRTSLLSSTLLICSLMAVVCPGQEASHRLTIRSKAVGVTYAVEVVVPTVTPPNGKTYPIVYCTDWFVLSDYLKSLPGLMAMGRLAEPYIMVGVSVEGTTNDWSAARTRDFTPARATDDYSKSVLYGPALGMAGGAAAFTTFLKSELIPLVESKYPGDPSRRGFLGYSLGGLLGTYILVREPELFQYYLVGSPSAWFNEYRLASELKDVPRDRLQSIKKIYLSVGEEESWEMLKGYGILRGALQDRGLAGSRIKTEIVAEAGHVGAMPISLYNGLRFLFRRD
jgi:predicted alpha/beta superfamily hydrolase